MNNKFQELINIMNQNNFVENSFDTNPTLNTFQNLPNESIEDMLNYYEKAEDNCPNIELCNNLKISQENICTKGSDKRLMCSFGESRIIMLLARLCSHKV
ncbi:MAG: hypothetical protein ACYDEJ_09255 [Desulfitobacteriaceae bacterium]